MSKVKFIASLLLAAASGAIAVPAQAGIYFSEFSVGGAAGEFAEIVNTGPSPVDLTGWKFNDNNVGTGPFDISALGTLAVGEAAIISEQAAATFRTNWGLAASVKVVGGNGENLGNGSGDDLRLYDNTNTLVDILTFTGSAVNSQTRATPGSNLGADNYAGWSVSASGDQFGSFLSSLVSGNYYGSPGTAPVPEPTSLALLGLGGLTLLARRRASK